MWSCCKKKKKKNLICHFLCWLFISCQPTPPPCTRRNRHPTVEDLREIYPSFTCWIETNSTGVINCLLNIVLIVTHSLRIRISGPNVTNAVPGNPAWRPLETAALAWALPAHPQGRHGTSHGLFIVPECKCSALAGQLQRSEEVRGGL